MLPETQAGRDAGDRDIGHADGATPVPAGYRADSKGRLVPEKLVPPAAALEDQLVAKIMGHADALSAQIARFKGHSFDDIGAFLALLQEEYGGRRGGAKGNMTFTAFDGCMKVTVQVADQLSFGPQLQVAKSLIDECIAEWAEGSRDEIRVLVEHAFRVDKAGQVSREAVFALRRIEIDDPRWRGAMQAITDSIRVMGSKQYMRFYRRATPQDRWAPVTIDIAQA